MGRVLRFAMLILLGVTMGAVALVFYVRASIHHLGFLTKSDVEKLVSAASEARIATLENKACLFDIDESSVGDKGRETEMLYVAAMLDLYRAKFGVAAHNIDELDNLPELNQQSRAGSHLWKKDCYVHASEGATIVSCGNQKPSDLDIAEFAAVTGNVERFYKLGRSEVLYIPSPKC